MKVSKDHVVSFDYKLRNSRGEQLDSSEGSEPLEYLHGYESIIPGLEKALEGRASGESLTVSVPPVEAYGLRDEKRMNEVPRSEFPQGMEIKPGMQFRAQSAHGAATVTVIGVTADTVTVDSNHPLAGETLTFDVTVRGVRPATAEEISHGHPHGTGCCGGHDHGDEGECCGGQGHEHEGDECCGGEGHGGCGCSH